MLAFGGRKPVRTSTSKSAAASEATFGAEGAACEAVVIDVPGSLENVGGRARKCPGGRDARGWGCDMVWSVDRRYGECECARTSGECLLIDEG